MNMIKVNLFFIVALALVSSCSDMQDPNGNTSQNQKKEVKFTSTVTGNMTKASGTNWSANDQIGVYMIATGTELNSSNIVNNADNVAYKTTSGDGFFTASKNGILFPEDGDKVDFIAYYPYTTISDYLYNIDVKDQSNPEKIDFMYSNNLTDRNNQSPIGNLTFKHELCLLSLNIVSKDGSSIDNIKSTVNNTVTDAKFNLANRTLTIGQNIQPITMNSKKIESSVVLEAILIPQTLTEDLNITLSINNKQKTISIPNFKSLESSNRYTYTINVSNSGDELDPEAENYAKWSETPVITKAQLEDSNIQYVTHYMSNGMKDPVSKNNLRNYSMLYDKNLKFAYWVAYPLFKDCIGDSGRTDAWDYDPEIDRKYQADLSSGFNERGYDRGHQIPSGDRTCDRTTNESTFYYSNMTPQIGQKMNQAIWADLENKVRAWMSGTDTVFVVTGAMPPKSNIKYTSNGMAIPEYYYKVLVRKVSGTYRSIAFKLENRDYSDRDFWQGKMSVAELEKETGFVFFPKLNIDKSTVDSSWN